mmetsp:Transcript_52282/g.132089  ORF Transcript_52282/g.132089 Transcript_52282/m.132089 type:complete len:261 (-) Transcript_52282:357-1139(-)
MTRYKLSLVSTTSNKDTMCLWRIAKRISHSRRSFSSASDGLAMNLSLCKEMILTASSLSGLEARMHLFTVPCAPWPSLLRMMYGLSSGPKSSLPSALAFATTSCTSAFGFGCGTAEAEKYSSRGLMALFAFSAAASAAADGPNVRPSPSEGGAGAGAADATVERDSNSFFSLLTSKRLMSRAWLRSSQRSSRPSTAVTSLATHQSTVPEVYGVKLSLSNSACNPWTTSSSSPPPPVELGGGPGPLAATGGEAWLTATPPS